jgi:hypothetical protein
MSFYITTAVVKTKPIVDKLIEAGWTDDDINIAINEAESYIESKLMKLGYSRVQLQSCQLVKSLCLNYCRYVILRDIYTMMAPSTSAGEEYTKWKEGVDKALEDIEKFLIRLVDNNGNLIVPERNEVEIKSTTKDIPRAISMSPDYEWSISSDYYSDEITNKK